MMALLCSRLRKRFVCLPFDCWRQPPISLNLHALPLFLQMKDAVQAATDAAARGYVFACTSKSEQECFDRMLFATGKLYGESVLKIKKGDLLFLLNLDTDTLYGTFRAKSAGAKDIVAGAWK